MQWNDYRTSGERTRVPNTETEVDVATIRRIFEQQIWA
jgi:hypothetical protein